MRKSPSKTQQFILAVSLSLSPAIACALGPANTVQNGPIINGGTYFNTSNGQTTFKNTSGGLWLKSGSNLRGVEVNNAGNLTNNGGTFHFYAPGQAIRLDGNVDVRGVRNNSGTFLGNGGKVFLDAAYVYQSGKIYANGINGGLVQFNVGGATLAGNARIEAKGTGQGTGGVVAINASGPVDIQRQVVLDTSGRVAGTFDTNVINIEGGLINVEGTLRASGLVAETDGISPGGLVRLVSTGQSDLIQTQQALQNAVSGNTFTTANSTAINMRLTALKAANDGDVKIAAATITDGPAVLEARGGFGLASGNDPTDPAPRAGDGGTIIITAQRNIQNGGLINASGGQGNPYPLPDSLGHLSNGGNGGTISLNADQNITNTGRIMNDGGAAGLSVFNIINGFNGGSGGLTAFSYGAQMQNTGVIRANGGNGGFNPSSGSDGNGGNGGLVVLSGATNPTGAGYIATYGGAPGTALGSTHSTGRAGKRGSIVAPNPTTATNILIGNWLYTEPLELLTHNENLILLGNKLPLNEYISPNELRNDFDSWLRSAQLRSVPDAIGEIGIQQGPALTEFYNKTDPNGAFLYRNFVFSNSMSVPAVPFDPTRIMRDQSVQRRPQPFYNTMTALSAGYMTLRQFWPTPNAPFQFGNGVTGGRISLISDNFGQGYPLYLNGGIVGGSINVAATGRVQTGGSLIGGANRNFSVDGSLHGGSMIFKAGQNLDSDARLLTANGGVSGGTIQLISQNQLSNFGSMQVKGGLIGGSTLLQAGTTLSNYSPGNALISANGGSYGGFIKLKAPIFIFQPTPPEDHTPVQLQATGSIQNGQIVTEH